MNQFILVLAALVCLVAQSSQQPAGYGSHLTLTVLPNSAVSRCTDEYLLTATDYWSPFYADFQFDFPRDCLVFNDPFAGHITLSRDRLTAIMPCCSDTPDTISFIEISFNGSVSPVNSLTYSSPNTNVHNMVKDGNNLWFSAYDPEDSASVGVMCYVNLTTGDITPLVEGTFLIDIVNDKLLVSNKGGMSDGLTQVGTPNNLPTSSQPTLTPVLHQNITVSWFVRTSKHAYYAQTSPESLLVRCDPDTWTPLYNLSLPYLLVSFVVANEDGNIITIFGGLVSENTTYSGYAQYVDNGTSIIQRTFTDRSDNLRFSLSPTHCENNVTDFGETDVDCGGLCNACSNTQRCNLDSECTSSYCLKDQLCTDTPHPVPLTAGNLLAIHNPFAQTRCSNLGSIWEIAPNGTRVQQIMLPSSCLVYGATESGLITLSRDNLSAVVPCCIDQSVAGSTTVGFVELYANGTFSPMTTFQLPYEGAYVLNIVKDGNNVWLVGQLGGAIIAFYVDLTSNQVVKLAQDDLNFLNFVGDNLVSSGFGLLQIGTGLPKSENQVLKSLLLTTKTLVGWFVHTDSYAYYATRFPTPSLVRCDPHTWSALYSIELSERGILGFVVLYNNDKDITIVTTAPVSDGAVVQIFSDNGTAIISKSTIPSPDTRYYLKFSAFTPTNPIVQSSPDTPAVDRDPSTPSDGPLSSSPNSTPRVSASAKKITSGFMAVIAVVLFC